MEKQEEQNFIHKVLLLHPKIFLFLADIYTCMYSSTPLLDFAIVWNIQTRSDEGLCTRQGDCSSITLLHAKN